MRVFIIVLGLYMGICADSFEKKTNIVMDKTEKLMWQDNQESVEYQTDISLGRTYCENLILNGYINWRMATIEELQTIMDVSRKNIAIKKEFEYSSASKYWSKTPFVSDKNSFWYVDFKTGVVNHTHQKEKLTLRCVRESL